MPFPIRSLFRRDGSCRLMPGRLGAQCTRCAQGRHSTEHQRSLSTITLLPYSSGWSYGVSAGWRASSPAEACGRTAVRSPAARPCPARQGRVRIEDARLSSPDPAALPGFAPPTPGAVSQYERWRPSGPLEAPISRQPRYARDRDPTGAAPPEYAAARSSRGRWVYPGEGNAAGVKAAPARGRRE